MRSFGRKGLWIIVVGVVFSGPDSPAVGQRATVADDVASPARIQQAIAQSSVMGTSFSQNCAGPDPVPCEETTPSMGTFKLQIPANKANNNKWLTYLTGCPGWQSTICPGGSTGARFESPLLIDDTTLIARSQPHTHGSAPDLGGTQVGDAADVGGVNLVSDASFTVLPAGFQGPAGTPEVHTELLDMCLTSGGCTSMDINVRVGRLQAADQPRSYGEVERKGTSGPDFPAESLFDVFAEVDIPACGGLPGDLILKNVEALLVEAEINDFPPQVVYIHGNTKAVPVYTKTANPGFWMADELVGWLTLSGHGVGVDEEATEAGYCNATEMVPPIPAVSTWGLGVLMLLTLCAATVVLARTRMSADLPKWTVRVGLAIAMVSPLTASAEPMVSDPVNFVVELFAEFDATTPGGSADDAFQLTITNGQNGFQRGMYVTGGPGSETRLFHVNRLGEISVVSNAFNGSETLVFADGSYGDGILVTEPRQTRIRRLESNLSVTAFSTIGTAPFGPAGMTYGADGLLYVTDFTGQKMLRVQADGTSSVFASIAGFNPLKACASDPAFRYGGAFLVGTFTFVSTPTGDGALYSVSADGSSVTLIATGLDGIELVTPAPGDVWGDDYYVATIGTEDEESNGAVYTLAPNGTLTPFLT